MRAARVPGQQAARPGTKRPARTNAEPTARSPGSWAVGAADGSSWRRIASGRLLDHDCSGHVRMQGAKVLVNARGRELERKLAVSVEHLNPKFLIVRTNGF